MPEDEILYHYTTLEAMRGILQDKCIWASHILYLDDPREFTYARELLRRTLDDARTGLKLPAVFFDVVKRMFDSAAAMAATGSFVACFSSEGDMLSQWRGYCRGRSGFSLGFRRESLDALARQAGFTLRRCTYDEQEQSREMTRLLEHVARELAEEAGRRRAQPRLHEQELARVVRAKSALLQPAAGERTRKAATARAAAADAANLGDNAARKLAPRVARFLTNVIELAAAFKHRSFHEEKEWRIVGEIPTRPPSPAIQFRPGKEFLIPYCCLPLPREKDGNLRLERIVIGPTTEPELSRRSVEMFLKKTGAHCERLDLSAVRHKNW